MKSLLDFIREAKTEDEESVALTTDKAAEDAGVSAGDVNKVVRYITHNKPSWNNVDERTCVKSNVNIPTDENGKSVEDYYDKVLSAVHALKDDGYFDNASADLSSAESPEDESSSEKKEEE